MYRTLLRTASTLGLVSLVGGFVFAAPPAKPKPPSCPVCKMTLTTKKTGMNTVPVKIKGKTYYCCSKCKMPAHK
jgi:YHS domain-containing protein